MGNKQDLDALRIEADRLMATNTPAAYEAFCLKHGLNTGGAGLGAKLAALSYIICQLDPDHGPRRVASIVAKAMVKARGGGDDS